MELKSGEIPRCSECRHKGRSSNESPCCFCINASGCGNMFRAIEKTLEAKITSVSGYENIAKEIAELVLEKQISYGDSFGQSEKVIKVLYPEGIKTKQYSDALAVIRVIDKLFRIANKKDAFGESPWRDVMGYALLSVGRDERNGE